MLHVPTAKSCRAAIQTGKKGVKRKKDERKEEE
jgi:hypothetical protein